MKPTTIAAVALLATPLVVAACSREPASSGTPAASGAAAERGTDAPAEEAAPPDAERAEGPPSF